MKFTFWIIRDGLHDLGPVERLDALGVLNVDRVEPLLHVVEHAHLRERGNVR